MNRLSLVSLVLLAVVSETVFAQQTKPAAKPTPKADPAFAPVIDDPLLPRVLIIGDSISIGYTLPTRELLTGKANVHRIATNGGPTTNGVANLAKWLGDSKWDVVHFNFGLHDIKRDAEGKQQVPFDQYEKNLRQMVSELKKTGARLVWASTTPVPEGNLNPPRSDKDVVQFNQLAREIMDENGVQMNDLYGFAKPQLAKIQRPVNVHFTDDGSKVLADQVAAAIQMALRRK
jgi:lysophospholipase L1-like esterase